MKIEIFGPGCPKCSVTKENVKKALAELKSNAEMVSVTDINIIIDKGIISTPALAIDGKILVQGKIASVEEIKNFIKKE